MCDTSAMWMLMASGHQHGYGTQRSLFDYHVIPILLQAGCTRLFPADPRCLYPKVAALGAVTRILALTDQLYELCCDYDVWYS